HPYLHSFPTRRSSELTFARRHGVPPEYTFAHIDDLLAAPRVADVAFICTPDVTHYSICAAVSAAGYDVLLEKPIATSLADCLALDRKSTRLNSSHVKT